MELVTAKMDNTMDCYFSLKLTTAGYFIEMRSVQIEESQMLKTFSVF